MVGLSKFGNAPPSPQGQWTVPAGDGTGTDGLGGDVEEAESQGFPGDGPAAQRRAAIAVSVCAQALPLVSLLVPAFNEATLLARNLARLCDHMATLESRYRWELVVVNDGSVDGTAEAAERFGRDRPQVTVVHHRVNGGLGQAIQTGARASRGRYVVVLDLDLSYAPEHIEPLLSHLEQTQAKVVVASPYMAGGRVSNVPWLRLVLSRWANRFLAVTAKGQVATLTGMVRAYDGDFLRSLHLISPGMEVNPEILHKAMLLHERIEEVPAHLCWSPQRLEKAVQQPQRRSSMKILRHTWSMFFFGFLFRPVMFFVLPSLLCFGLGLGLGLHAVAVLLGHWLGGMPLGTALNTTLGSLPHTLLAMGLCLMLAVQLFGMGLLAVQNKRYFEEMFYLGMRARQRHQRRSGEGGERPDS
ncbi:glycosyltransferase family 2 protein [Nodosilinea sp. PGN35]|uniref:glycosyltransferase family 2 protein n=1 Tax=Nodosilinea sp. PGN35 TaxID=3020489 RepID=UPI0023B31F81|nr:glycosyltransferase family 2 protein [Nodosilinea sp. TSF1-S3]MDF0367024.1 glycosyltransferase family 2 protein [Nodosilinea sp. TSF1-S3]